MRRQIITGIYGLPEWDIVGLYGQSNAQGAGETIAPVEFRGEYDNVYITARLNENPVKYNHPVNDENTSCGIDPFFIKKWADDPVNQNRKLLINKYTQSGRPLFLLEEATDFNAQSVDDLADGIIRTYNASISFINQQGGGFRVLPNFWLQGESDSIHIERANAYNQNLQDLIAKIRSQTGITAHWINTLMGATTTQYTYRTTVRQAKIDVSAIISKSTTFDLQGYELQGDEIHHTTAAYQQIGDDLYDLVKANNYYS